jgi:hypothetical protein
LPLVVFEHMIESMGAAGTTSEATSACAASRRSERSSGRRRAAPRKPAVQPDPAAWPEFAPPVGLAAGPLGAVQAADREIARQTAIRARALAEFAASRPASVDRVQGEPGAMSPERWASRPEILRTVS